MHGHETAFYKHVENKERLQIINTYDNKKKHDGKTEYRR